MHFEQQYCEVEMRWILSLISYIGTYGKDGLLFGPLCTGNV